MIDYLTLRCPRCGDLYQAEHRDVPCPCHPAEVSPPAEQRAEGGA